jgi:hypothetical protein
MVAIRKLFNLACSKKITPHLLNQRRVTRISIISANSTQSKGMITNQGTGCILLILKNGDKKSRTTVPLSWPAMRHNFFLQQCISKYRSLKYFRE